MQLLNISKIFIGKPGARPQAISDLALRQDGHQSPLNYGHLPRLLSRAHHKLGLQVDLKKLFLFRLITNMAIRLWRKRKTTSGEEDVPGYHHRHSSLLLDFSCLILKLINIFD